MIEVPAGTLQMGTSKTEATDLASEYGYHPTWFSGETPREEVHLDSYAIDRYPVTNEAYHTFCEATDHRTPSHWDGVQPPASIHDHPVVYIDRSDAEAYAEWAGKRLPTEAEWEKAARGPNGQRFPWGETFDPERCCWNHTPHEDGLSTAPVTAHESGASPYGVVDMIGNAAEWCLDPPTVEQKQAKKAAPGPGPTPIKGGAWLTTEIVNLRPAARNMSGFSDNCHEYYGFRCAEDR